MATLLLFYFLTINAAGFTLMLADKRRAVKKLWRIPESTLMTAAILGGSIGSLLGMYLFRHKTRHLKFALGIPAVLAVQIAAVLFVLQS